MFISVIMERILFESIDWILINIKLVNFINIKLINLNISKILITLLNHILYLIKSLKMLFLLITYGTIIIKLYPII